MFPSLLYKVIDRGLQAMPGSWRIRRQHQDAPEIVLATIRRWKGEPKTLQTESSTKDDFEIFVFKDDFIGRAIAEAGNFEPRRAGA
jgi:hypothetical protein